MLGTYVLSAGYYDAYYLRAQRVRTLIRRDFDAAFADVDLDRAGRPATGLRLGERIDDPLACTSPTSTPSGEPRRASRASVVRGRRPGRSPVGLQLIARPFAGGDRLRTPRTPTSGPATRVRSGAARLGETHGRRNGFEAVIGLEMHAQLNTESKIFCGCENRYGAEPSTLTCPLCLGSPSVLPVINEGAVEKAIMIGLALQL